MSGHLHTTLGLRGEDQSLGLRRLVPWQRVQCFWFLYAEAPQSTLHSLLSRVCLFTLHGMEAGLSLPPRSHRHYYYQRIPSSGVLGSVWNLPRVSVDRTTSGTQPNVCVYRSRSRRTESLLSWKQFGMLSRPEILFIEKNDTPNSALVPLPSNNGLSGVVERSLRRHAILVVRRSKNNFCTNSVLVGGALSTMPVFRGVALPAYYKFMRL